MNTRATFVLGTCLALTSWGAHAQTAVEGDVEASGGSYVATGGLVLKTGLGECLQTGTFSEDNIINQCEGIEDEVAEVAEVAEEVVVAEAPKPAPQTSTIDTRQFNEKALFDTDSAELNNAGQDAIGSLLSALAEYKGITDLSVIGHTDSRGSNAYNQALSERRAQTVAAALSETYPNVGMNVQGMGEDSPVASNDTAEGRQLNRRVEIEVTATRMIFN